MKKTVFSISILLSVFSNLFCFDWPFQKVEASQITSFFGQKNGSLPSTSLIISDAEDVISSDEGNTLIVIEDSNDDTDFFPSALGTSVIVSHNDNLICVYSNLDRDSIRSRDYTKKLTKAEPIAKTGKSGFQKKDGSLSFQLIDIKERKAINPLTLLPQLPNLPPLSISAVQIRNKNGVAYDLQYAKNFNAGTYRIYFKRNDLVVPFKTSILLNGELSDEISLNSINQEGGTCNVMGIKNYSGTEIYPDDKFMLIGEAALKSGKFTLSLLFTDIKGDTRQLNYNITVY